MENTIGGNAYQNDKVNNWTGTVVETCLQVLTQLQKPYKYIGEWPYLDLQYKASYLTSIPFPSSHLYDNAEERSRTAHSEFVLLEQRHGRLVHGALGEQDHVLHRLRLRTVHLNPILNRSPYYLIFLYS